MTEKKKMSTKHKVLIIIGIVLAVIIAIKMIISFWVLKTVLYIRYTTHQYSYYDDNYTYTSKNLVPLNIIIDEELGGTLISSFHEIEGIPKDEFVFKTWEDEVRAKNDDEDPFFDYTVEKAELYWCRSGDMSATYGQDIFIQSAFVAEHQKLINYLRDKVNKGEYEEEFRGKSLIESGHGLLVLRLYFSEYENLVWDGRIYTDGENHYVYLYLLDDEISSVYIKLDEEMSQKIKACADAYSSQESGEIPG